MANQCVSFCPGWHANCPLHPDAVCSGRVRKQRRAGRRSRRPCRWPASASFSPGVQLRPPRPPFRIAPRSRNRKKSCAAYPRTSPSSLPCRRRWRCRNVRHVRPPEALLTPDPLLHVQHGDLDVRVSFIVGSDGHVHSAFVLDSGGLDQDQIVLRTIRFWRYRPALCNGVPTDSEARVRFSIR